jgi:hypothetical protein
MEFKDITTWSVSKGVATPVNPYKEHNDKSRFTIVQKSQIGLYANFVRDYGNIKLATNAPDGSYSSDRFELKTFGCKLTDMDDLPGCKCGYLLPEAKLCPHSMKELKFIDQVKAESPKFGEWISINDHLPENRNWCLVMCNKELFLANYKHGIFETEKPLILQGVTHWTPLPSPPKTL